MTPALQQKGGIASSGSLLTSPADGSSAAAAMETMGQEGKGMRSSWRNTIPSSGGIMTPNAPPFQPSFLPAH
eukprot:12919681-Prorocentrum_lima.AAC.1